VVHRVTWPDEEIIRGSLEDIARKVRAAKWTKQALILVGEALRDAGLEARRSRLYSGDYSHIFRQSDAQKARRKRTS
jgi:precorrin-4 methylase